MEEKRYPKGHFTGQGTATLIPVGVVIGLVMGSLVLGIAIGAAIGIPIGVAMEKKYNPNPIPLTNEQNRIKKRNLIIILSLEFVAFINKGCCKIRVLKFESV